MFMHHRQETDCTCGAAAMRMVLESFGIKKSEKEVAKLLGTSPNHGTWFRDFVTASKKLGLSCIAKGDASISELRNMLKQKYRVIVCYLDLKDHRKTSTTILL